MASRIESYPNKKSVQSPDPADPVGATHYCAQLTRELRDLAQEADLPFLAYLLEMAHTEAIDQHALAMHLREAAKK